MRCGPADPRARHCFWPGPAVSWTAWLEPGGAERVGAAPSTCDVAGKRIAMLLRHIFTGPSIACSPTLLFAGRVAGAGRCGEGGHRTTHASRCVHIHLPGAGTVSIPILQCCRSRGWSRWCAGREGTAHNVSLFSLRLVCLVLRGCGVAVVVGCWGRGCGEAVGAKYGGPAVGTPARGRH